MLCPHDQTPLQRKMRQQVEIDYCPTCRGVWLDRGELEKLIALAVPPAVLDEPHREAPVATDREPRISPREEPSVVRPVKASSNHRKRKSDPRRSKRKRSFDLGDFLEDIFDFD